MLGSEKNDEAETDEVDSQEYQDSQALKANDEEGATSDKRKEGVTR